VNPAASRSGRPAKRPVVGCGHVAGEDEERLPICVHCLRLPLEDVRRFREGMSPGQG